MRLRSFAFPALAMLLVGTAALAFHEFQELSALRSRLSADDSAALRSRIDELNRRNRELQDKIAALEHGGGGDGAGGTTTGDAADADSEATLKTVAAAGKNDELSKKDAELDALAALADTPEFEKLLALQQRGAIDSKYAALFRKLHLSPEQQQQFERLLADRASAYADAMLAAHDQGLTGKDARQMAATVARATQKDIDDSMKTLLGPDQYKQYQNYERTMPQRELVNDLAQRLSYTQTPLTSHQQDQLVQTLASAARQENAAAAAQKLAKPAKPIPGLPGPLNALGINSRTTAPITTTAVMQAQGFLTEPQLASLQQMQQEQQARLTLGSLLRGKQQRGAPPPPPPSGKH